MSEVRVSIRRASSLSFAADDAFGDGADGVAGLEAEIEQACSQTPFSIFSRTGNGFA